MIINNTTFNCDLSQILDKLDAQLALTGTPRFEKRKEDSKDIMVCCPYHNEKRPSAGMRKSDGKFHCFACGEVHELPEVISYCLGYKDTFGTYGWSWLLRNFATVSIEEREDIPLDFNRNVIKEDPGNVTYVSEEELDQYRYYHAYWSERGITDNKIIELFDLGYDKKTDCITMPVKNSDGHTLFVARRSVKTKFFNYPKDAEKPLYGLYEYNYAHNQIQIVCAGRGNGKTFRLKKMLESLTQVFICESMIDALLLWQAGFYAFALNGTGSSSQIEELKKLPIRKYILCTDNDKAGEKARRVLREALSNKLITEIKFPPERKDVGECTEREIQNILDWEIF